ncbi:MAG TPA: glutamate 5-kinase [Thermoanaerobaculia bacterium]|nr:glutamate 5-kinase [Thermoanaerobaculia bacterium]
MESRATKDGGRDRLRAARRIVVKVGTHVVTHEGRELALGRLMQVVESLARLRSSGCEVILVTSGAVAMGMQALEVRERPRSLGIRQAFAAVGQGRLMGVYSRAFGELGLTSAQVLLTQEDLADRDRALCLRTTLMRLLELGVVPVLNENDSVSVRELVEYRRALGTAELGPAGFGDNDGLSARVAVAVDADLLVLLTDVDGLHTGNPANDADAVRVSLLPEVSAEAMAWARGSSGGGTGGMVSKLEAAALATARGTAVLIASGHDPRVLDRALAGDEVGTLVPAAGRRPAHLRHIAVAAPRRGALVVNEGALAALEAGRASLLPVGVVDVEGSFVRGDVVEVRDGSGRVRARGLVNYDAVDCRALAGRRSHEIDLVLGFRTNDALINRHNLAMGAL